MPIISTSVNRNAAIYSGTRVVTDSQLAPMQIGIRNTLSMISISANPSIPSAQVKGPKIGADRSTNCHCAPPTSKFAHRKTPSAKSTSVAASASQRAPLASSIRHPAAASAGTSTIIESIGKPFIMLSSQSPR